MGDRIGDAGLLAGSVAEGAQPAEHTGEPLEQGTAAVAPGQVAEDAALTVTVQLTVNVVREERAGLLAVGDPGSEQDVHHGYFSDAGRGGSDSRPYDAPMLEHDDQALAALARAGDIDAFTELVRRHERRLRAVVARLLDDARDVDEAVQDAFVKAWRSLDGFRGDAQLSTWLYRIGVNEALMRARRVRRPVVPLDAVAGVVPSPRTVEDDAAASALASFLAAAIRELPPDQRAALVLRDVAGLANEEVASVLELTLPAAKSRIHRARLRLAELLAESEAR